jgi:hypothetical protein
VIIACFLSFFFCPNCSLIVYFSIVCTIVVIVDVLGKLVIEVAMFFVIFGSLLIFL